MTTKAGQTRDRIGTCYLDEQGNTVNAGDFEGERDITTQSLAEVLEERDPFPEANEPLPEIGDAPRVYQDASDEADARLEELRSAHNRVLLQLSKAKATTAELVDAVHRAASDAARALVFRPIPSPPPDSRAHTPEVAIAVLSDFQLAKRTPTYNTAVCEERIDAYAEKLISIAAIQRADHPVEELRVWLLGDIVEGELIFPGQSHLIDASLYSQVTVDGPRILGNFFRKMLDPRAGFRKIHVTAVIGNHGAIGGRARRDYSPESNSDRMLYRIMQMLLANEPRVTWNIPSGPTERNWYAIDSVGETSWLLCHGDQFRWGVKTPSTEGKILGWATGAIPERFDEVVCGHWHNINSISLKGGALSLRVNGSTESFNTYAQEFIGSMSAPAQWLMFAHPRHGITAEYKIWLAERIRIGQAEVA